VLGGDALEAGHDHRVPSRQCVGDAPGPDVEDAGLAVQGVGDDARLRTGEGLRGRPQVGDGHGEQRHRDALAGGEQHVELPRRRVRADPLGELDQLVGVVAHGGHDRHDVVAGLARGDHPLGDTADLRRVRE
jgi:hypothetical protein